MYEILQNRIDYHSIWDARGGQIILTIDKTDIGGGIFIRYIDTQNAQQKIQSDLEEI